MTSFSTARTFGANWTNSGWQSCRFESPPLGFGENQIRHFHICQELEVFGLRNACEERLQPHMFFASTSKINIGLERVAMVMDLRPWAPRMLMLIVSASNWSQALRK